MLHRALPWLSLSVVLAALPAQERARPAADAALQKLLAQYDTNRDGAVQKAEYPRGDRGFAHLDRDGDGDVDAADFAAKPARGALQQLRQLLQAPKLPQVGDMAPDFELPMVGMKDTKVRLSKLRGDRPVALVFGSITCPPFRSAAGRLRALHEEHGSEVAFFLVYVREAHPIDGAMPGFEQLVEDPVTDAERLHVAGTCMDDLGLTMPALVDGVDDAVCRAYGGWPDRLYLVGKDGRIAYAGAEGPFGFDVEGWGKALAAERAKLRAGVATAATPTDLGALLEPLRAQFDLPALGAAIVSGGELVALGTTGVRARGSDVAVEDTDLWHLGSCTKAMTATLAARLVEQGKLQWDSTVGALLPDVAMHEDWRPVRLDWLLQHRGGMASQPPRALWQELWERDEPPQAARRWFVGQLLQAKPDVAPGTKAVYSNQGFNLAGVMLEAAAGGTAWEQLMREQLFAPLGMASAGFGAAGSATTIDQPRGHRDDGRTAVAPGKGADNPASIGPAGTVHASLADWAKFTALHLCGARGEKGLLLQPESFRRLHTAAEGSMFAMGWVTAQRPWAGGRTLTHNGSNTMNFCRVWIAPERDHAFLVVTNCAGEAAEKATDAAIGAMVRLRGLAPR